MKLSIVVITKNEEDRIKTCLESVKFGDEIIILDNGSTDKTLEIAKSYTEKVLVVKNNDFLQIRNEPKTSSFAALRNKGMEEANGDWVLYIDADERVLKSLKDEILDLITKDEKSAYAISRRNIIFGKEVSYGPYKNDWMIRLFRKKDFEIWVGKVHEYGKFKGDLGYTKNSLLHLTHRNIDHFILKSLEWSKIDAQLRFDGNHPKMTGWRFLRILKIELFNQLVIRKGFFGGTVGIIDATLQAFSLFITYVRLWEMQQKKPLDEVYDEIDKKLIEKDFDL